MSRYNIFKVIREIFREVKVFGNEEISVLKKQLEQQKQELEKLKVARAERLRREEQLALAELRRAVASLQNMDSSLKQHERLLIKTANDLERQAKVAMEGALQKRASDILASIDYDKILTGDIDVEDVLPGRQQQQQQGQQQQQQAQQAAPAQQQQQGQQEGGGAAQGGPKAQG